MTNLKEAQEYLKDAEKTATPSKWLFFTSSPDYYSASEQFTKAANTFKLCKEWQAAGDAFKRAAEMDASGREGDEGARKMLNAASCYKKIDPLLAIATIKDAIAILLKQGRFHLVAGQEKDVAEMYCSLEMPKDAIEFYEKAAERYLGEDSQGMAQQCSIKAATLLAEQGEYERAAEIFELAASECAGDQLRKYSIKDFLLKGGFCRLCCEDRVGAKRAIEGYLGIDHSFGSSQEWNLLQGILEAIEQEDSEVFTDCVAKFDRSNTLDNWKTAILLKIKENIITEPDLL